MNGSLNGFLNVLKPPGMSSSDAVVMVRRMLPKGTRVGHAGTLDPEAAGVLPIMVGKAARLFDYLVDKEKTYVVSMRFGVVTDTRDAEGTVLSRSDVRPTDAEIEAALPPFTGEIWQTPPAFSALKREGKPLYELARAGQEVEVEPRRITVHSLTLARRSSADEAVLTVRCGRGTYIRSLCHDIGQVLGCGATMDFLLRSQSGMFTLENAWTVEQVRGAHDLSALMIAMDAPLQHLPRLQVRSEAFSVCVNGNPLRPAHLEQPLPEGDTPHRIYIKATSTQDTYRETFAGIGHRHQGEVVFDAMLMERENA